MAVAVRGLPGAFRCATPSRIWDAASPDGRSWPDVSVVTEPVEVAPIGVDGDPGGGITAFWATMQSDHDWSFQASLRDGSASP